MRNGEPQTLGIDDRTGREHLAGTRQGPDARGSMDAHAGIVVAFPGRDGRMQADADLRSETRSAAMLRESALDRDGALDRLSRVIERDEEPIANLLDLLPAVRFEYLTHHRVMPRQHVPPRLVSKGLDKIR